MANFDLNDDSVVVIVGSGAGGGTLGTELALKGVKTVILEAGARNEIEDFVNDEWDSFLQLAWKDMRTTSGSWRVHKDFPNLPAWIVKSVGGSTVHWAGASLRLQEHEFKTRTTYGDIGGANLLDWPITLAEMEPYYAKAEDKMGVTRTNNIPGLPGNNNFKVLEAGAKKVGYKEVHTGRMAINSEPRDGRGACQQIGFCFQGCKSGGKWSTLYAEIPKGEATGKLEVRPDSQVVKIEHDASGKVTGVVYADKDGKMQRQKAANRRGRRQFAGKPTPAAQFGLLDVPRRARQFLRPGRAQLHAPHDGLGLRGVRQARSHVARHDDGGHRPRRGGTSTRSAASSAATNSKRFRSACPSLWRSSIRARGAATSRPRSMLTKTWRACGSLARTCRRKPTGSRSIRKSKDKFGMPVASVHFDDHANDVAMRDHAWSRGKAIYEAVGATAVFPTPPYPSTHNLGTNRMSEKARDGVVNSHGQTHDIKNLFVSDGSQFTTGGAENPTLTIVSLAIRQADFIADQMGKNTI